MLAPSPACSLNHNSAPGGIPYPDSIRLDNALGQHSRRNALVRPQKSDHKPDCAELCEGRSMWKPEHRRAACRRGLRYPSDLTDVEWALVEPLIPPAKRGGRRRTIDVREVLNAIFYVLSTGCQWNALPSDLPPKSTVYDYLDLWDWDGTLERIHHALYVAAREQAGREASPSVAIIDAQSAKGAVKGGPRSTPRATTRARRSKGASATSSSIPLASS